MNGILARAAVQHGEITGEALRLDTTAVETNIHWPTDSSLLWDSYRTLAGLIGDVREIDVRAVGNGRVQLDRVKKLLAILPTPHGLFLNDLQGAPSACGCGNPLCRWTSDYGKRRTTTPLGDDAATLFVNAVKKAVPNSKVIPVWTTECEKHDGSSDGLCAGVGCFDGICWKAYTRQLAALEQTCNELGVLVPYRAFQRDIPIYGEEAGWILHAVKSFSTMPPKRGGKAIKPSRLITILQGWDVDDQQVTRQIEVSAASGTSGFFVAYVKLDQSWRPKVVSWR